MWFLLLYPLRLMPQWRKRMQRQLDGDMMMLLQVSVSRRWRRRRWLHAAGTLRTVEEWRRHREGILLTFGLVFFLVVAIRVKLWDIGTMDKTVATFNGHTDLIWGVAMIPMHAQLLCSASQDATVHIWDARHPQNASLVVSTLLPALSVDWHPRQSTVFSVGLEDGVVCTFDVRSPHKPLARKETHKLAVHVVKYSPYHDDLLATGGDDGKAFVTTDSFSSIRSDRSGVRELLVGEEKSAPHRDYVRALEWFKLASEVPSSDDKKFDTILATGSWDKSLNKWSAAEYTAPVMDGVNASYISEEAMPAAPPGVLNLQ